MSRSLFNPIRIDYTRKYVEKHADFLSTIEVVDELCDETQKLWEENVALREQIFQIEQEQNPEKRWETILAAKLARGIRENNGKDYLEFTNSTNNDIFIITIQKKFGRTPEQLLRSSEIRRLKAAKRIVNLVQNIKGLETVIAHQTDEIKTLKLLKKGAWDEITTRQEINTAISMINSLIRQYNQEFYRREFLKLSNSMRELLHEAWTRVADSNYKIIELKKKVEILKIELNRKNVEKSKFSKYRKKGNILSCKIKNKTLLTHKVRFL